MSKRESEIQKRGKINKGQADSIRKNIANFTDLQTLKKLNEEIISTAEIISGDIANLKTNSVPDSQNKYQTIDFNNKESYINLKEKPENLPEGYIDYRVITRDYKGETRYTVVSSALDLSEADLKEAKLLNADLPGGIFIKTNFEGADLRRVNLQYAHLNEAILTRANLTGADLQIAFLNGAQLLYTQLLAANLIRANLAGADLTGANLHYAHLNQAILTTANLANADLAGANLAGANLAGANLAGANLAGANLAGADLTGAILEGAILTGIRKVHDIKLSEGYTIKENQNGTYDILPQEISEQTESETIKDNIIELN